MTNTSQLIRLHIAFRQMEKNNYYNRENKFTRTHHIIYEHREREPPRVTYGFCHVNCLEGERPIPYLFLESTFHIFCGSKHFQYSSHICSIQLCLDLFVSRSLSFASPWYKNSLLFDALQMYFLKISSNSISNAQKCKCYIRFVLGPEIND